MKTLLGFLFLIFVVSPMTAIVQAWTLSTIWAWYLSSQYGAGPAFGAWYGFALLFTTGVNLALYNVPREKTEGFGKLAVTSIGVWIGCALVVGSSGLIGLLLGWI